MSNGIQPLGYLQGAAPVTPADARTSAKSSPDFVSAEPASAQGLWWPNPSLNIDPALGIVIIEFHAQPGEVSFSIPTARQLDAYRSAFGRTAGTAAPPATATAGGTGTAPPGPVTTDAVPAAPPSPAGKAPVAAAPVMA